MLNKLCCIYIYILLTSTHGFVVCFGTQIFCWNVGVYFIIFISLLVVGITNQVYVGIFSTAVDSGS